MNVSNVNSPGIASASEAQAKPKGKAERKKSSSSGASEVADFNGELMQLATIPVKAELPQAKLSSGGAGTRADVKVKTPVDSELSGKALQNGKSGMHAQSVDSRSYAMNVNRSPGTQIAAASLNTASAIAGLKPWSKEWVFEGNTEARAIKPLITPESSADENSALARMAELEQLLAAAGMARAGGASGRTHEAVQAVKGGQAAAAQPGMKSLRSVSSVGASSSLGEASNAADISGAITTGPAVTAAHSGQIKGTQATGGAAALSGGEFLSTLNAIRSDSAGAGQSNSGSSDASGGNQGRKQMSQGASLRPDLRVINGGAKGRGQRAEFGDAVAAQAGVAEAARHLNAGATQSMPRGPLQVTGHVTQGAMTANRLSSESLLGISAGIRELKAHGGGEIRVRLKPENLGELHLRVVTNGNNVGLHIQASDENAKKILEQTMSHLKDSLASQNLTLGRVELTVASSSEASGHTNHKSGDPNQGNPHQGQQSFDMRQNLMGQNQNGNQRQWNIGSDDVQRFEKSRSRPALGSVTARAVSPGSQSMAGAGRLDVMA